MDRDDRIRTCDLLFPKQERYQTALHPCRRRSPFLSLPFFFSLGKPSFSRVATVISVERCPAVAASLRDGWSHDKSSPSFSSPPWPEGRQGFLF